MMKKLALGFFSVALALTLQAANTAQDNASNLAYQADDSNNTNDTNPANNTNGWVASDNGGFGFSTWTFNTGGSGGHYIGGTGDGNPAFGLFSGGTGGGNFFTADRSFTGGGMSPGQTFSITTGVTGVANGGVVGLNLLSGTNVVETFKFTGGQSLWQLNDGGVDYNTNIGFSANTTISFAYTYDGGNSYDLLIKEGNTTYTQTNSTANAIINNITGFRLFSVGQGGGENIGFNFMSVPEPSTWLTGALAILGALFFARRRRVKA
jgi:PEP-CTERM motif